MIWAMLTLLFAVLLGGGGGSAEVKEAFKTARKQVKEVIAEPERQREVRSDLKQMNKLLDKGRQYQQKSIKEVYKKGI